MQVVCVHLLQVDIRWIPDQARVYRIRHSLLLPGDPQGPEL